MWSQIRRRGARTHLQGRAALDKLHDALHAAREALAAELDQEHRHEGAQVVAQGVPRDVAACAHARTVFQQHADARRRSATALEPSWSALPNTVEKMTARLRAPCGGRSR